MHRSRRTIIWASILAILVISIALLIAFWNWNWFKPIVQAQMSSAAGQKIELKGDLNVHLSWVPRIELNDIDISNDHWQGPAEDSHVATIKQVAVSIDLKKLFVGQISLPDILIDQPDLTLRRVALDQSNWTPTEKDKPTKRSALPEIGRLEVRNGKLDYQDSVKGLKLAGNISTVEGNGGNPDEKIGFTLSANGSVQKTPLVIKASGGPLMNLSNTSKPYPIDIDVTLLQTHLKLDGAITDPTKLSGIDATLELQGPSTGDLFLLLNIPAPETPPYHISGHLVHRDKEWDYDDFKGVVGDSDLAGTIKVDTSQPKLFVTADLLSKKLDFKDIGPIVGIPPEKPGTTTDQKKAAAAYHADERILPDAKLDMGKVRSVNADVEFKASSVLAPGIPLDNVDLHVVLKDSVLALDPLNMGVANGQIHAIITINAKQEQVQTDYDIGFKNFELDRFMKKNDFENGGTGKLAGRIQLKAPGNSVRESLGNANGSIGLLMDKGQISDLVVAAAGLDIGEVLKVVTTGDKLIPIRCIATHFNVDNGLMTPSIFVIDTDPAVITGSGTINLKNEMLDLKLSAEQKEPSFDASTPIDVTGHFKHPGFGLDTVAAAERGGAALALGALLTPLGSLLAFVDPGFGENTDCVQELQQVKTAPANTGK
jgi:uncharacterized protein involved in outer membrane biogenesis